MSLRPFSPRFPWKLLNYLSPTRQLKWISGKIPSESESIRLPFRSEQIRKRWIVLNQNGEGWPACGNILAQIPGETTLFAPTQQSGVIHPGSTLRLYRPDSFLIGSGEMNQAILAAQTERPDLILCLDDFPSLPILYFIGQTRALYRIGFGNRASFPFFNISLQAKSSLEWGTLLSHWIRPV